MNVQLCKFSHVPGGSEAHFSYFIYMSCCFIYKYFIAWSFILNVTNILLLVTVNKWSTIKTRKKERKKYQGKELSYYNRYVPCCRNPAAVFTTGGFSLEGLRQKSFSPLPLDDCLMTAISPCSYQAQTLFSLSLLSLWQWLHRAAVQKSLCPLFLTLLPSLTCLLW